MLQIYFDFCGYSNRAIGLAFLLGFTYPKNFDYPYAARSITEFWRRWHMSLSSWFRDYVYVPLGGNRHGLAKTVRNLLIVFLLTGLWHGAAWSFVVWGLYHGAFLMLERFGLGRILAAGPRLMQHAYVVAVVGAGWVFFRAEDLPRALAHFKAMAQAWRAPDIELLVLLDNQVLAALAIGAILSFPALPRLMTWLKAPTAGASHLAPNIDTQAVHLLPIPALVAGLMLSVALLVGSSLNPFLYFRF
jgi:alginate O-acetyltransferase complex protein AlgI